MPYQTQNLSSTEVEQLIQQLGEALQADLTARGIKQPLMLGIHTGGAWVAERLHRQLGLTEPLGRLDISFYRDDYSRIGMNPEVRPSDIPVDLDNRHLLLIDDVLYSGRTIRAALNEIFDYGRPASVTLAVLVKRDGRELPIEPGLFALHLTDSQHWVTLRGPEPLELVIGPRKGFE